ncbi:MAG: hypothetical protein ACXW1S_05380, partial [Acidimicrobiia bacterium]
AYFPTQRFDEVRQVGNWTLGRAGDGYVALWSWRPTTWRTHDPAVTFTNGLTQPFDLVAEGGANNAWVVEVGDANGWGSFDAFAAAVAGTAVEVTDLGVGPDGLPQGFDVAYKSPAEGRIEFSSTGPLTVDGSEVPLHGTNRFDNPFGTTADADTRIEIADGAATLSLDTQRWTRRAESRRGR